MDCFSGRLMSSASDQKLFCEVCSALNCSFDEFVGEKVVSPSYSSALGSSLDLHFIAAFVLSLNYCFTFNETVAHSRESKVFEIRGLMQTLIQAFSNGLISCFSFSILSSGSFIYLNVHKHLLSTFLCAIRY